MKEVFITLKTARAAKEVGFAEPSIAAYDGADMLSTYGKSLFEPLNYNKAGGTHCSAPTQAAFQQWLRQENDIHIVIDRESLDSDEMCYVYEATYLPKEHTKHWVSDLVRERSFGGVGNTYYGGWATYEEALEAAFQFALALIIKQKGDNA